MKEELLSIVTHALIGVEVEKETVDMIVEQSLELLNKKQTEFVVKISDGYCEWEYGFDYHKEKPTCIYDFAKAIERQFGIKCRYEKLIK